MSFKGPRQPTITYKGITFIGMVGVVALLPFSLGVDKWPIPQMTSLSDDAKQNFDTRTDNTTSVIRHIVHQYVYRPIQWNHALISSSENLNPLSIVNIRLLMGLLI